MTKIALASALKKVNIWSFIASVCVLLTLLIGFDDLSQTLFYKGLMVWALLVIAGFICPVLAVCLNRHFKKSLWLSAGVLLEIIVAFLILMYAYGSGFY